MMPILLPIRRVLPVLVLFALVFGAVPARAQGYALSQFEPSERGSAWRHMKTA